MILPWNNPSTQPYLNYNPTYPPCVDDVETPEKLDVPCGKPPCAPNPMLGKLNPGTEQICYGLVLRDINRMSDLRLGLKKIPPFPVPVEVDVLVDVDVNWGDRRTRCTKVGSTKYIGDCCPFSSMVKYARGT